MDLGFVLDTLCGEERESGKKGSAADADEGSSKKKKKSSADEAPAKADKDKEASRRKKAEVSADGGSVRGMIDLSGTFDQDHEHAAWTLLSPPQLAPALACASCSRMGTCDMTLTRAIGTASQGAQSQHAEYDQATHEGRTQDASDADADDSPGSSASRAHIGLRDGVDEAAVEHLSGEAQTLADKVLQEMMYAWNVAHRCHEEGEGCVHSAPGHYHAAVAVWRLVSSLSSLFNVFVTVCI
jgi:hypothetical protein